MNSQQIKFCHEYVNNGCNGTQAYLKAYKSCKKEKTAMANASRLLRNDKVLSYIEELQEELKSKAIMSAQERMEWLTKVVKGEELDVYTRLDFDNGEMIAGHKEADINTKIKALDTLNKMSGEYKTILDGKIGVEHIEVDLIDD